MKSGTLGSGGTAISTYLPKVPVPVQHMAIFYYSVAEHDRDVLKLPIRGCVQAVSASRRQWRKWIGAAE